MYKIVICDDDKNFISYMKEMLLRCDLSERQVTFYEVTSGSSENYFRILYQYFVLVYQSLRMNHLKPRLFDICGKIMEMTKCYWS